MSRLNKTESCIFIPCVISLLPTDLLFRTYLIVVLPYCFLISAYALVQVFFAVKLYALNNFSLKTWHLLKQLSWFSTDLQLSRSMSKPTKWHVHPGKTQISLGICPVWSESSLSAWKKKLGSLATHWAYSEDWSDWADAHADMSLRWVHRSFRWFCREAAQLKKQGDSTRVTQNNTCIHFSFG